MESQQKPTKLKVSHWYSSIIASFNSLLGRFLTMAIIVVGLTAMFAWDSNNRIIESAHKLSIHLSERASVDRLLSEISDDLWKLNTSLQNLVLNADNNIENSIFLALNDIGAEIDLLQKIKLVNSNETINQLIKDLRINIKNLIFETKKLKAIKENPLKLFPSMPLMVNNLNPNSVEFYALATIAMRESEGQLDDAEQRTIYILFSNLRSTWAQKINAFRMFAASRLGIFNVSIESNMNSAIKDIEIYDIQMTKFFKELNKLNKSDKLGLEQSEAIPYLIKYKNEWNTGFKEVKKIYLSGENWRLDTPVLKHKIHPLFSSLWENLDRVKRKIEFQTRADIKETTSTADDVSNSIWFLSLLILTFGFLGTLAFEFQIRRPIKRVSNALKAEADGVKNVVLPNYNLQEIRDLVGAFSNMRNEVNARQERLQSVLNNTAEGIVTFDENGIIETWNSAASELFGWSEQEALGSPLTKYISSSEFDNREQYLTYFLRNEIINLDNTDSDIIGHRKNGDTFPLSFKSSKMILGSETKYTALIANVTQQKAMLENLRYLAEHDGLTGLHNRAFFNDELNKMVEKVKRNNKYGCSILYIDLDNFKYVNDTLGHAAGDKILVDITQILQQRTRKSDLLARLGGDEFVILLTEDDVKRVEKVADNFREQIANYSLHYDGKIVDIGCSIGVAIINSETKSTSEAMSQADVACHFAKRAGRNRIHIFSASDSSDVETMSLDMGWSRRIKQAIENNTFVLALQPIVNTITQNLESYEVLIRMRDDNDSIIMPFAFLPTAERFGLAVEIDTWVIKNSIKYLSQIRQQYPDIRFSVNLSAQSLTVPEIPKLIPNLLNKYKLNANALTFEVTETSAIADMSTAVVLLSDLQKLGCKTSLDDFGSGMSSFAYLRELPVDIVKIDGSFVKNMTNSPVDQAMLKAMNDIAHALGKQTVAEFVEDDTHLELLKAFKIDYAQGYFIDKPKLINEVFPMLDNNIQQIKNTCDG
jgi:diguanylate cyclase (GGDEF)-like protein/PAS domain S-box-containing protein